VGFQVDERLGDDGTFYYPKEGLVATAVFLEDVANIPLADASEREKIIELRKKPVQHAIEQSPRGLDLEIDYNLVLKFVLLLVNICLLGA